MKRKIGFHIPMVKEIKRPINFSKRLIDYGSSIEGYAILKDNNQIIGLIVNIYEKDPVRNIFTFYSIRNNEIVASMGVINIEREGFVTTEFWKNEITVEFIGRDEAEKLFPGLSAIVRL